MTYQDIKTTSQLANYLRCNTLFLENAINKKYDIIDNESEFLNIDFGDNDKIYIHNFNIKKKGKSGGFRKVHSVQDYQLGNTLKILNNYLSTMFLPQDCVHGFIKGRSTRTNAKPHLSKKILLSLDIKNYFESISKDMISNSLSKLGFQKNIAENISNLVTINGYLVQGFCTSPTIANIVTDPLDREIVNLCGKSVVYTRYADDLSLSSNQDEDIPEISIIEKLLAKYGFKLNKKKTNKVKRGHYQFVTGLTIFDNKLPRIPKKIKRNLKLEIYYISKLGYKKHAIRRLKNSGADYKSSDFMGQVSEEILKTQHRLFGWIHYIMSIEPIFGKKMYDILIKCKKEYITPEIYKRHFNL